MAPKALPTIDDLLLLRGVGPGELAKIAGISAKALWSLRQGHIAKPRIATITRLAKALRVSRSLLLSILTQPK